MAGTPPWRSDCRSMLFSIQGPEARGVPQPGDNNRGKKPSFYTLVMGLASLQALFSFFDPHSHPSQDLKASTRMWSLPWQDSKVRTHQQPGVQKMFSSAHPLPQSSSFPCRSERPETTGHKEITEPHRQHSTYRSDTHMQVRDSLGTGPRQGLV